MAPSLQKVKILGVKDLTEDVKEFTLENPGGDFRPGQFATIKINDGQTPVCMRSYSVLKGEEGQLQLIVKNVEGGRGTTFLFAQEEGSELEMLYPLGHFGLPEKLASKLVFIGTGTGLAPLLCMLEGLPSDYDGEVELLFGVRFTTDLFYLDRIEKLSEKLKNFKFTATVSRPQEGWDGAKGRVTEYLDDINTEAQYIMCGTHNMVMDVKKMLEEKGVPKEKILFENFG